MQPGIPVNDDPLIAREPSALPLLTDDQKTRALGAVLGAATGDALGAPYEFEPPIAESDDVEMVGGGHFHWRPGEWTDDTAMAIVILHTAAEPALLSSLVSVEALDDIAAGWYRWSHETVDIGNLTSAVMTEAHTLARVRGAQLPSGRDMHDAARAIYDRQPRSAGNGSLMRAFAVVLPYLRADDAEFVRAVALINALTHVEADTTDAVVLWSFAIRHAIMHGELDIEAGLRHIAADRRDAWLKHIDEARTAPPAYFARNGWVVHAFQAAFSAIAHAGEIPAEKFAQRSWMTKVLDNAVRAGNDTDTVASIAGALAGAVVGHKAIDPAWRRVLNGWPGYTVKDLEDLVGRVLERADAR